MQAAIGCAQLEKLDSIVEARRSNFAYLKEGLAGTSGLILPEAQKNSDPSWFGFLISVKEDAGFTRNDLSPTPGEQEDPDTQPVCGQPTEASRL